VDVLISFKPGSSMTLEIYMAIEEELKAMFGREIDLVERRFVKNPFRRYEILATRRIPYAA
jgi:hypothetical protein